MIRTMRIDVVSPGWLHTFEKVVHLRIEAVDGARGVQPGHEYAHAQVVAGPVEMTFEGGVRRFLATEGGVVSVERDVTRLVTPWATVADDLSALGHAVRDRGKFRVAAEQEARTLARRHEKAAHRALVALRRGRRA